MIKILGFLLYFAGFLGAAFATERTSTDIGSIFVNILLFVLWLFLTVGVGWAMINFDDRDKK